MAKKKTKKRQKIDKRQLWFGLFLLFVLMIGVGLVIKAVVEKAEILNKFPDRGVPRINIELSGTTLEEIDGGDKKTKYPGNELTVYEGSNVREFVDVEMKGRGNWTWQQEKKPYRIEFNNKVDLFGLGKARKWCLLANASDGTNLRNELAFNIARMLGMKYTMDGRFVELYVDGDYRGLYYLTHVIETNKVVVDLKNSLGILVELDDLYWGDERFVVSNSGDVLTIKDAVTDELSNQAMEFFLKKYNRLEGAIAAMDYELIEQLVDVDSFAEYYLLSELSNNPDAYSTSFYFYMDGPGDVIHAGPGWDYDLAFGNRRWEGSLGEKFYSPTEVMVRRNEPMPENREGEMPLDDTLGFVQINTVSQLIFDLMDIPEFQGKVREIFNMRLSDRKKEIIGNIVAEVKSIDEAIKKNEEKWGGYYVEEFNEMIRWLEQRYDFLESLYGSGI